MSGVTLQYVHYVEPDKRQSRENFVTDLWGSRDQEDCDLNPSGSRIFFLQQFREKNFSSNIQDAPVRTRGRNRVEEEGKKFITDLVTRELATVLFIFYFQHLYKHNQNTSRWPLSNKREMLQIWLNFFYNKPMGIYLTSKLFIE